MLRFSHPLVCAYAAALLVCMGLQARAARVGLIVGEPFGSFGAMMPQGHASVYLADWCADSPVRLRPCGQNEPGVVLSRYHDLRRPALDWMAVPLVPFLYGVEDAAAAPATMDAPLEMRLREAYWRAHLQEIVPPRIDRRSHVRPPKYGDWEEGIGAAFDRRVLLYTVQVSADTEARLAERQNHEPNTRQYTLGRENCADFAAELLREALPGERFPRNVLADFDMTTPKTLARELDTYGRAHPELKLQIFAFPQVPGSLRRSRPILGAAETLVTEKRYTLATLLLQPEALLAAWIVYEKLGKYPTGFDAIPLAPEETARFVKPSVLLPPVPLPPESPPTASASARSTTGSPPEQQTPAR